MTTTTSTTPAKPGTTITKAQADIASALVPAEGLVYTVGNARSGKGGLDNTEAVLSDIGRRQSSVGRVAGAVMFDASLAAWRLVHSTKAVSQRDYAEGTGFAASYVSRLVRIGRYVVDLGVVKGSERFTFLASHGSNARVGALLKAYDDGKADKAQTMRGLDLLIAEVKEHGKITSGARTPQPNDGTDTSDKADQAETETGTTDERAATIGDVLDALDAMVKGLDREVWAATENRLQAIITREVTVRAKADAPKPAAPRKGSNAA
jgi:hypothetical protein